MAGQVLFSAEQIQLINITPETGLSLVGIGFAGGLLSGFLGTGGGFVMTPAMMSLGIPGIMAVAANMAHKFGKSVIGSIKYDEFGGVDKKLGLIMFSALIAGVKLAVTVNKRILDAAGVAASNLYISIIFVFILAGVSVFIFRDIIEQRACKQGRGPRTGKAAGWVKRINLPPLIYFKVAGTRASLWPALAVGFATGFLAGTIGGGGFIGIPAMVYLLGVPIPVAAGTGIFLAIFSGMQGTFLYAVDGYVDVRIPLLLYLGSIVGVTLGAVGSRVVRPSQIKLVMALIMAMVVFSRASTVPVYLTELGYLALAPGAVSAFNLIGKVFLFGSGLAGCALILFWILKALAENRSTTAGGAIPRPDKPAPRHYTPAGTGRPGR
ncbi:MAG: sulfite exporter TauE/SafE family protein [Bacillota bacterium]